MPGEGHGHLMVDGQLQTMIFEPQASIAELSPGTHDIAVMLSANDHSDYVIAEERVGASVTIEVAGRGHVPGRRGVGRVLPHRRGRW